MQNSPSVQEAQIEATVKGLLGDGRVKTVSSELRLNDDGAPILRITVVYSAQAGLSVDEMGRVLDAIWPVKGSDDAPFPVIDFQEDSDVEPIAAE